MTEPIEPEMAEASAKSETPQPSETPEPSETSETSKTEDFEGPRRRARRSSRSRRAAQARATAIEEARREAKRKVLGQPEPQTKTLGRGTVRGLKVLMWTAVLAVIVVGLGLLLYFTPIMSARSIVVTGVGAVTQEEVVAAAAVAPGTPLLQVNTDAVAERVAGIRRVASARVQRQYPSTLRITLA